MIIYKQLINDFLNHEITLQTFYDTLLDYSPEEIKNTLECLLLFYKDEYNDEQMITYVLLWSLFKCDYSNIDNQYTRVVKAFNTNNLIKTNMILNENDLMIYEKGFDLYLINYQNEMVRMTLPTLFSNRIVLCVSCNEELTVKDYLDVYNYSFYVLN